MESTWNCVKVTTERSSSSTTNKPLKTIIVLVIIAMCLSMADGAPKAHAHKRRHDRVCYHKLENLVEPKDATKMRHGHRDVPLRKFAIRMLRIRKRLTNTLSKFSSEQNLLNETKHRATGKAAWLPKVNFVDIARNNSGAAVKRFELLVPKLYKNLKQFQYVFEHLQSVRADIIDASDPNDRRDVISKHQKNLHALVTEVEDAMREVNRCVPDFNPMSKEDYIRRGFNFHVNQSQRLEQDALAYRAYTKMLKNWKKAFRCGVPNLKDKGLCRSWRLQFVNRETRQRNPIVSA